MMPAWLSANPSPREGAPRAAAGVGKGGFNPEILEALKLGTASLPASQTTQPATSSSVTSSPRVSRPMMSGPSALSDRRDLDRTAVRSEGVGCRVRLRVRVMARLNLRVRVRVKARG